MALHTYGGSIEIPEPLIQVRTEEVWKDAGFTGYREYTTTISVGDVVLLERTANDEDDYRVTDTSHQEETVNEFGKRLKEVLGL
jgi:lysozyme family protein